MLRPNLENNPWKNSTTKNLAFGYFLAFPHWLKLCNRWVSCVEKLLFKFRTVWLRPERGWKHPQEKRLFRLHFYYHLFREWKGKIWAGKRGNHRCVALDSRQERKTSPPPAPKENILDTCYMKNLPETRYKGSTEESERNISGAFYATNSAATCYETNMCETPFEENMSETRSARNISKNP